MENKTNKELFDMLDMLNEQYEEKKKELLYFMDNINNTSNIMSIIHNNYIKCLEVLTNRNIPIDEKYLSKEQDAN